MDAKTKVEFLNKLPSKARLTETLRAKPEKILVIYDKKLSTHPGVSQWLKDFPLSYPVRSGESLKDINGFATHVRRIGRLITPFSKNSFAVIALGGGSVGDFAGFLSSVLKRGVPLIHIPSTLLAAMDSSHGGKTALNIGTLKNQIGTFYPAESVMIVKSLFEDLPSLQLQSAAGELAKMALLAGGGFFARFKAELKLDLESIWSFLPEAIEAKYKVVEQDPFEETGERQNLNFGHSLGHALESYYGLAHGVAVGEGLVFALKWSEHQGFFRGSEPEELVDMLSSRLGFLGPKEFARKHRSMSRSKLAKLVSEDKKLTDARRMNFVFLQKVGAPFRKVVTVDSLLTETQRQGWTAV